MILNYWRSKYLVVQVDFEDPMVFRMWKFCCVFTIEKFCCVFTIYYGKLLNSITFYLKLYFVWSTTHCSHRMLFSKTKFAIFQKSENICNLKIALNTIVTYLKIFCGSHFKISTLTLSGRENFLFFNDLIFDITLLYVVFYGNENFCPLIKFCKLSLHLPGYFFMKNFEYCS